MHVDPQSEDSNISIGLKLLKFSVPTFDGDIMRWSTFWDLFSVSIHDKKQLSDTKKLVYLRDALQNGPVEAVISGLARTGETYGEAIDCLRQCYDRPHVVHQAHVSAILSPPILRDGNCKELHT